MFFSCGTAQCKRNVVGMPNSSVACQCSLRPELISSSATTCLISKRTQRQCIEQVQSKRQRRQNLNFSYLFQAALLGVLSVTSTMSAPLHYRDMPAEGSASAALAAAAGHKGTTTSKPRWINPCGLPGHVFDADKDTRGTPNVSEQELYERIINSAANAKRQATKVKEEFLNNTFSDSGFEDGVKDLSQKWLPKVPQATEGHFRKMNQEVAFKSSFEMLQYFAVGIQQIILDETLHSGKFVQIFKDVEFYLTTVLCDLQMGMYVLKIQPNDDVLRNVMSHEYRDTSNKTTRHMRDYVILRDYIKAVEYVAEMFAYLQSKVNQ